MGTHESALGRVGHGGENVKAELWGQSSPDVLCAPLAKHLSQRSCFTRSVHKGGNRYHAIPCEDDDILNAIIRICLFPDFIDHLCWLFAKEKGGLLRALKSGGKIKLWVPGFAIVQ